MDPDLSHLDTRLTQDDFDGYLIHASGEESNQRYLSGFTAPDPYVTLYDGEIRLLVTNLEYGRAVRTSRAATVERPADYNHAELAEEHGRTEADHRVLSQFLEAHDAARVLTPERFPLGVADGIRKHGVEVAADTDGVVERIRATKTNEEIEYIREAQRANEAAMARAEHLLREAEVINGELQHDGDTLTSEDVKQAIEAELLRQGCALDETIVACGADAADPHDRGSGPLTSDASIIIDIFPRSKATGYFADMTRTFVKGEPSDELTRWYDLTLEAQKAALDAIGPGVNGRDVHAAVCDVYEAAGHATLRAEESAETGFIHSTGHGLGLDIHEWPRLSTVDVELEPGMVLTVEPGLYDPEVGGVRIEDLVVVTGDGVENLADYEKRLRL